MKSRVAQRPRDQLLQLRMHRGAAVDELAAVDRAVAAAKIADEAAGLAHEQHTRRDVPHLQVAFPETVVTARPDPCEVEAGGAEAQDTGAFGRHGTRKSVVWGKRVRVRVDRGGPGIINQKKKTIR